MSSLQFFNAPNDNNNDMINNNDKDPIIDFSIADPGLNHTPWCVTFNFNSPMKQASEITPGTQEDMEEVPDEEDLNETKPNDDTHGTQGIHRTQGDHRTTETEDEKETKEIDGPFLKACNVLSIIWQPEHSIPSINAIVWNIGGRRK